MDDETAITGSYPTPPGGVPDPPPGPPVEPPPGPPVGPPGAPPGRPPPPGPPRAMLADAWPWLALLGLLALAALLVWLFVIRDKDHQPVVPAVVGLPRNQAIARLTKDGYSVTAILGPSRKASGIVVSQIPGSGSRLPKGRRVTIHVSNGRAVVTTTTTAATTRQTTTAAASAVPYVVGQDMASGSSQVEAAGFVAETDPRTGSQAQGQILRESPSGQAPAGSVVQLSVAVGSKRPQQPVPDVVGRRAADARAALLAAKLTVRTQYRTAPRKNVGTVLAQRPNRGSAPAYTQVTLTVGR
ncbi:MAG: eukaryotic-like serine/threonine-protein kinase [Actinomycetota bacterium]